MITLNDRNAKNVKIIVHSNKNTDDGTAEEIRCFLRGKDLLFQKFVQIVISQVLKSARFVIFSCVNNANSL